MSTGAGQRRPEPNNRMDRIPVDAPSHWPSSRIVAKVDELMELCDRLDASLSAGEDIRSRLLDTFLYRVLEGIEHHKEDGQPTPLQQ